MAAETGHQPNRCYIDQNGNFHANGCNTFDAGESTIPAKLTYAIAPGAATVCNVTIQVADGQGNALAGGTLVEWWLSDNANAGSLTATAASGTVGAGAAGTDMYGKVSKKAGEGLTDATGKYILQITDAAKTPFYVCAMCPGTGVVWVAPQLVTANYG